MAKDGQVTIPGLQTTIEFSNDGGAEWNELLNASDISATGGEHPESEIVGFKAVSRVTGLERIPTITITMPSMVPHHAAWEKILDAKDAGDVLQWRFTTRPQELASSGTATAAIAMTTGAVTLAPSIATHPVDWRRDDLGPGLVIEIATKKYIVATISETGAITVSPAPTSAVAAAAYKVLVPSLRKGPFSASISSAEAFELPAEGALNASLAIRPLVRMPRWVVV